MKSTREVDYAVMTMAFLARATPGELVVRREIASRLRLPEEFLAKVLKKLSRAGLVRSFQGARGGCMLGRASAKISLAEIVSAIEGPVSILRGMDERTRKSCRGFCLCDATEAVRRAEGRVVAALEETKLAEMAGDGCGGPVRRFRDMRTNRRSE